MTGALNPLVGVSAGAVLATVGGFAATQLTVLLDQRRRRRQAALLSGEILAVLARLLKFVGERRQGGGSLDPATLRLLRTGRRELTLYEHNRELMFSLSDADLRASIHTTMLRLIIPLDQILDDSKGAVRSPRTGEIEPDRPRDVEAALHENLETLIAARDNIEDLLRNLRPLARDRFDGYDHLDAPASPVPRRKARRSLIHRLRVGR
jgi:hypothetical protein